MAGLIFPHRPYLYARQLREREELFEDEPIERVHRRRLIDRQNPFDYYDEDEFQMRFRFPKEEVMNLITLIFPHDTTETRGEIFLLLLN